MFRWKGDVLAKIRVLFGDRVEMGRNREYRSGFLSALEHRFLFCTFRRRARSVTEVIPFGGNTFQGPWNTRRKRQLAQKILAYVEIEATRASKRYRQGRNERMNEYAFHSRGMEFVVTLAVWERRAFRREKRVQFPTGPIKMPRRGRYVENAFRRNECLHRNYRLSMLNCLYRSIYLESCKTNLRLLRLSITGEWSNLIKYCDVSGDVMRFDRAILKDDRRDSLRFILVEKPEHVCSDHRPVRFNTSDRNEITSEWLVKKIMQFSRNSFISISNASFILETSISRNRKTIASDNNKRNWLIGI